MEFVIYVGLAILALVVLLLARGKKTPAGPELEGPDSPAPAKKELATDPTSSGASSLESAEDVAEGISQTEVDGPPVQTSTDAPAAATTDDTTTVGSDTEQPASTDPSESSRSASERSAVVAGMRKGLARSRDGEGFFGRLKKLFGAKGDIPADLAERIEEILLTSDVGVSATSSILAKLRDGLSAGQLTDERAVWNALKAEVLTILEQPPGTTLGLRPQGKPTVVLMIGVNGAGKTTTIGKLATKLSSASQTVVLAAGDTFRAAAVQQLVVWGQRVGCEVVRGKDGADPGSVVFDAVQKGKEVSADFVLADTAGRLHTKSNLMSEMQKIERTAGKAAEGAPHETLLVIDATNGQNAMAQAKEFNAAMGVTGIVLTKLDGTAKGGFVLGIVKELGVPVRYVGMGERPDDLFEFNAEDFVEALFGDEL